LRQTVTNQREFKQIQFPDEYGGVGSGTKPSPLGSGMTFILSSGGGIRDRARFA
jgi:hypothetical protein